jgi:hypothetical protein
MPYVTPNRSRGGEQVMLISYKLRVALTVFAMVDISGEALAKNAAPAPTPTTLPGGLPIKKGPCTNSGLGGTICSVIIPRAFLTEDELNQISKWHQQNILAAPSLGKQKP